MPLCKFDKNINVALVYMSQFTHLVFFTSIAYMFHHIYRNIYVSIMKIIS